MFLALAEMFLPSGSMEFQDVSECPLKDMEHYVRKYMKFSGKKIYGFHQILPLTSHFTSDMIKERLRINHEPDSPAFDTPINLEFSLSFE